jgi:hypothetical protein
MSPMYLSSTTTDLPERERIIEKALLDPGDRRVGAQLEEEDAAEVGDGGVCRAGVLH